MSRPQPTGASSPAQEPYHRATRQPLYCLVFLLPLVTAYELGALLLEPDAWPDRRLVAQRFLQQLAAWFGTDAVWVPGAALIVTLLVWQLWSRNPWRMRLWVPALMVAESLAWTLPLFLLGRLLQQTSVEHPATVALPAALVLALGAGVYEELVFRLYLISGLKYLLGIGGGIAKWTAAMLAAVLAAVVFAACHLEPVGAESFTWPAFLALSLAGGYLGGVFVLRGLGVSTGCHAAYNLISLLATHG